MTLMRIYYTKRGGHVHCRVFTGTNPLGTFAKCGDLVFNEREWPEVADMLARSGAAVVMEPDD